MEKLFCTMFAFLSLAMCSFDNNLMGNEYKLTNAPNNADITLSFDAVDKKFYGKVLNRYFGTYTTGKNEINFNAPAATLMAGPSDLMEAESIYLKELYGKKTVKIDGKKLILKGDNNKELVFEQIGKAKGK